MVFRLFTPLLAVVVTLLSAAPVSATSEGHSYLALGDSVAFGTSLCAPKDPNRCVGYPEHAAQMLNVEDVNASCPGEASGGFISLTGTDNVCRPYRAAFPLHIRYSSSQLDFAVSFLRNNPRTRLVTIDIGANDLFALQRTCARTPDPNTCLAQGFPRLLQDLASNLSVIYGAIRSTGYSGLLIGVTYYLTNYTDPVAVLSIGAINQVVESVTRAFGGFVANGFAAFQRIAAGFGGNAVLAGLVIPGDIHPTAAGQVLLAQTVVNTIRSTCPAANARGCLNQSPRSMAKPG